MLVAEPTEGKSAHGSSPHLGRNAIYPLASAIAAISALTLDAAPHPILGEPTFNVGTVPGMTSEGVLEQLRAAAEVTIEPILDLAPVATDPTDESVQSAFEIAGSSGGGLAPAYGAPPTVIWGPGEGRPGGA